MAKIVKNTDSGARTYVGQLIESGQSYTLEVFEQNKWAISSDVLDSIANGDLVVNDGSGDLSAADGANLIRNSTNSFSISIDQQVTQQSFAAVTPQLTFRGTNYVGTPYKIKLIAKTNSSSTDVRLYDVTNAKVICQKNFSGNSYAVIDMGTLSNLSSREAVWEIQAKVNSILTNVTIASISVYN